jgi:hypothetical protein
MNETLIFQLLLSITKQMPYTESVRQLNTFAVVQDLSVLSENLNSVQSDLKKGYFWNRDWVATGAIPSDRKATYPMLLVRRLSISPNDNRQYLRKYCQKFAVSILDIDTKDNCVDCGRNAEEIKTGVFKILHAVKYELLSYAKYSCTINGINQNIWATPNEIAYLTTKGTISNAQIVQGTQLINYIRNISDFTWFDSGIDGATAIQIVFDFCGCEDVPLPMNYGYTEGDMLPVLNCESCEQ